MVEVVTTAASTTKATSSPTATETKKRNSKDVCINCYYDYGFESDIYRNSNSPSNNLNGTTFTTEKRTAKATAKTKYNKQNKKCPTAKQQK